MWVSHPSPYYSLAVVVGSFLALAWVRHVESRDPDREWVDHLARRDARRSRRDL